MKNLYEILKINPQAKPDEIKRGYFLMAKKYHPDSDEKADVKKFYEVSEAYQILSDPEKRRAYDLTLKTGKLEKELVTGSAFDSSAEDVVEFSRATHGQDPEFRSQEMNRYRQKMIYVAFAKVVITALVGGVIGNTLAILLNGALILGIAAGLSFGIIWAMEHYFDLASFIESPAHLRVAHWGGKLVQIFAVLYFVGLFLYHLLGSN